MTEPALSILIPTLTARKVLFDELIDELFRQKNTCGYAVEIISKEDAGELACGEKRNRLLKAAHGKYCVFVDDDDAISPDYLSTFTPMMADGTYTHASVVGLYYENGVSLRSLCIQLSTKSGARRRSSIVECRIT